MGRYEKEQEEYDEALNNVQRESVEPTEEEIRNGWTSETLSEYLTERKASQSVSMDWGSLNRKVLPDRQNHKYNVKHWRK